MSRKPDSSFFLLYFSLAFGFLAFVVVILLMSHAGNIPTRDGLVVAVGIGIAVSFGFYLFFAGGKDSVSRSQLRCPACCNKIKVPRNVRWKQIDCEKCRKLSVYVRDAGQIGSLRARLNVRGEVIFIVLLLVIGVPFLLLSMLDSMEDSILKKTIVIGSMIVSIGAIFYFYLRCPACRAVFSMRRIEVADDGSKTKITSRCQKCGEVKVDFTEHTSGMG